MRNGPAPGFGSLGGLGSPAPGFAPAPNWNTPQPFGQPPGFGQQPWAPPLGGPPIGGWSHNQNAFAANGAFGNLAGTMHRAPGNRALNVRLAICNACRSLTNTSRGEGDGYHDVNVLLKQMDGRVEPLPSFEEIEAICETEGTRENGGGEPDQGRGSVSLGEIGSPMPTKSSPAFSFGAPDTGRTSIGGTGFQSLGAVGSGSSF